MFGKRKIKYFGLLWTLKMVIIGLIMMACGMSYDCMG